MGHRIAQRPGSDDVAEAEAVGLGIDRVPERAGRVDLEEADIPAGVQRGDDLATLGAAVAEEGLRGLLGMADIEPPAGVAVVGVPAHVATARVPVLPALEEQRGLATLEEIGHPA